MLGYYFVAIMAISIAMIFKNSFLFALCFLGATTLPSIAVAGSKWGILRGDRAQQIGVPVVGLLLLAFAYWLSGFVSLDILGWRLSGLELLLISAVIGLVGIPLSWAE